MNSGKEVAIFVERYFISYLSKNENFRKGAYVQALEEVFLDMDVLLSSPEGMKELSVIKGTEDGINSYAGCTACVALLIKNVLYVANAGDSRCVLSTNKEPYPMSNDHKPDLVEEKRRITKAGGYISNGRVNGNLNLSRALGDFEYKKDENLLPKDQLISCFPEVIVKELGPDDEFLVLGCDGIWESLSNYEIVDFIGERLNNENEPVSKICGDLINKILAPDTLSNLNI